MAEPRIILFDLETLADLRAVMTHLPSLSDYPGQTLKASINSVICFGFKVFGEGKAAQCKNAWDYPGWRKSVNDDRALVEFARETLLSADAVVTHNGKRFDWKFLQTRLMAHGMKPLPKMPHIDTCQLVKQNLYLINNRMNTVAKHLKQHEKLENGGWKLWEQVQEREPKAMKLMSEYCKQDVMVLEGIFKLLRPFAKQIPNYNLWTLAGSKPSCPMCGSTRVQSRGTAVSSAKVYQRLHCQDCGAWSKAPYNGKMPRSL